MRKLFERIVDFMEENGSIQSEYRDVYLFALQTIAVYAFNIGTGVVIGAAFGELLYCMIFLIAFMLFIFNFVNIFAKKKGASTNKKRRIKVKTKTKLNQSS